MVAALAFLWFVPGSVNAAVITVFSNNQAGWNAAAGSPVFTEPFSGGPLVTGLSIVSGNGTIGSPVAGRYNDVVDNPIGSAADQVTFGFATPIQAFGGIFDLTPGGSGLGIQFQVFFTGGGSQIVGTEVPDLFNGQFFGFVSDMPISSVQLFGGTQGGAQETFNLDNLQFTHAPEPTSLALFGLGTLTAGYFGLRRRKPVVA